MMLWLFVDVQKAAYPSWILNTRVRGRSPVFAPVAVSVTVNYYGDDRV
jgi:hypothetical protein